MKKLLAFLLLAASVAQGQTIRINGGGAPINNPVFTGTPKIGSDTIATKSYARSVGGGGAGSVSIFTDDNPVGTGTLLGTGDSLNPLRVNPDISKFTTGTLADSRISSATAWNSKMDSATVKLRIRDSLNIIRAAIAAGGGGGSSSSLDSTEVKRRISDSLNVVRSLVSVPEIYVDTTLAGDFSSASPGRVDTSFIATLWKVKQDSATLAAAIASGGGGGGGGGTPANPSASVGLTAVNGAATTYMRSDAAPALSQSIVPTWTGAHTFNSTINKVTITPPTTSATLTLATGSTLQTTGAFTLNNTLTANSTPTFPSGAGTLPYIGNAQVWTGLQTFNSGIGASTINSSSTNLNFHVFNNANAVGQSGVTSMALPGSSNTYVRVAINAGVGTAGPAVSNNYVGTVFGTNAVSTFASGTHTWFSGVAIKAMTITNGGGAVTNSANLYLDAAPTGATNNYSLYSVGKIGIDATNTTAGTTGAQTINKPSGKVNFAAAASSLVVTNSLVTANSIILVQTEGADATAHSATVTPAAGSFTITLNAAATAETRVSFIVFN